MVFRTLLQITPEDPDPESIFLCVANLDWGVLSWPLVQLDDGLLELDRAGSLRWHFVFNLECHEACVAEPVFSADKIVLKAVEQWLPACQCMIGAYSADIVFRKLVTLAELGFNVKNGKSFSRPDLLKQIALGASKGDADFAQAVVEQEEASKKKRSKVVNHHTEAGGSQFANLLMENMDKEDAKEFADEFKRQEKMVTKRKWQKWKQDADDETWLVYVTCFHCGSHLSVRQSFKKPRQYHIRKVF